MANSPFTTPVLRNWLIQQFDVASIGIDGVSTMGSGPFSESEFDEFIQELGIGTFYVDEDTEVLVLGEEDWDGAILEELLRVRSGETLRVYSQEMFLSFLLSEVDPLGEDETLLRKFGEGHAALEFLSAVGFDWPSTTVVGGGNSALETEWLSKGYLKYFGYSVGRRGLTKSERQEVLTKAYLATVPGVFPQWYRESWGKPNSSARLLKTAESLAAFCRNAKRRPQEMQIAISHWEADLDWLKRTYSDGKYRFEWPSTKVW